MKEKLAETCILDLSRDVSAMLWEPRLCPAFWADACAYACLIHNRVPNSFLGGDLTPEGVLTGHRVRWDKFRVLVAMSTRLFRTTSLRKSLVFHVVARASLLASMLSALVSNSSTRQLALIILRVMSISSKTSASASMLFAIMISVERLCVVAKNSQLS